MSLNIDQAVEALDRMTITDLRARYAEVFGEPTRSGNKQHLVRRIAWRLQAIREGGLSERARQRAMELANDADLRLNPPRPARADAAGDAPTEVTSAIRLAPDDRLPMPGTLLQREYKSQMIQVRVMPRGFEYNGEVYRSLSAIAKRVTGSHWNGFHFFGLASPRGSDKQEAQV